MISKWGISQHIPHGRGHEKHLAAVGFIYNWYWMNQHLQTKLASLTTYNGAALFISSHESHTLATMVYHGDILYIV